MFSKQVVNTWGVGTLQLSSADGAQGTIRNSSGPSPSGSWRAFPDTETAWAWDWEFYPAADWAGASVPFPLKTTGGHVVKSHVLASIVLLLSSLMPWFEASEHQSW